MSEPRTSWVLVIGKITRGGEIDWLVAPPPAATEADVDVLIEEVYGKPGLGVLDSAGLFDEVDSIADAYELGQADQAAGRYAPPTPIGEHDAYIRGQNDAWAAANSVNWWRRRDK